MMNHPVQPATALGPVKGWLPHDDPMVMLDSLEAISHGYCRTRVEVDGQAWYALPDGAMPAWFGLELMAQTVSAYSGYRRRLGNLPVAIGYLLGTLDFQASQASFPAGASLEVEAKLHFWDGSNLSAFSCQITNQGEKLASAILKFVEES
jgi:predicted hotdog family 3-hydroxylacyl-ACP dehydratase